MNKEAGQESYYLYKAPGIAPRLRPGEVMPQPLGPGKIPTRVDGEIVFVSSPGPEDKYYNRSPYTDRQIREIEGIRMAKRYLATKEEDHRVLEGATRILFDKEQISDLDDPNLRDYLNYKDLEPDL